MESGRAGEIDAIMQHRSYLAVVTGGGQSVRYFNLVHGDLVWEASDGTVNSDSKAHAAVINGTFSNLFPILTGKHVYQFFSTFFS